MKVDSKKKTHDDLEKCDLVLTMNDGTMLVFKSNTQGRFKLRWKINGEVDHYYNNNCMNIVKVWQRQFWKQKKQSLPFCKKQVPKQNLYHPYQVHQTCVLAMLLFL